MFICSFKTTKTKLVSGFLICAVTVGCLAGAAAHNAVPAMSPSGKSLTVKDSSQRTAFLAQFGWEVKEDPLEVAEIIVPAEFNAVYKSYNDLQKLQGFDLTPYGGKRLKRWTYEVTNYPGYVEREGAVRANILVLDDTVVGGDICCVELDGFMHGFNMESASQDSTMFTNAATTAAQTESTTALPKKTQAAEQSGTDALPQISQI